MKNLAIELENKGIEVDKLPVNFFDIVDSFQDEYNRLTGKNLSVIKAAEKLLQRH